MATIKFKNGENAIYNGAGFQAKGSFEADQEGLYPKELIEGALGMCVSLTLKWILEKDGKYNEAETEFNIQVTAADNTDKEYRFSDFEVEFTLPESLGSGYKEEIMERLEKYCTIGNTLKNTASVRFK